MKALFKYLAIFIIVFCSIFFTFKSYPNLLSSLDNQIKSFLLKHKNKTQQSKNIIIVDIDDKSISQTSQWPWRRDLFANLIYELQTTNLKVIGVDILFSKEDINSPFNVIKTLNLKIDKQLPNYDELFSKAIKNSSKPIILGYHFFNNSFKQKIAQKPYSLKILKKTKIDDMNILEANNINMNIDLLQSSAYSTGFLNIINSNSSILTNVPLIIKYENELYPSFALEVIRTLKDNKDISIKKVDNSYHEIQLDDLNISVDKKASLSLSYYKSNYFKTISAIDILNKNYDKTIFNNKIVLLGNSALDVVNLNNTLVDKKLSSTQIHATIIENILNKDFFINVNWQDNFISATIFIIFASLFLTLFFNKLLFSSYISLLLLFFISFGIFYFFYIENIIINSAFILISLIIAFICTTTIIFIKKTKELILLKKKFAAKVSSNVMNDILKDESNHYLRTKQKDITIFFSDIIGFSQITNQINDPEKLTKYLNKYMNPMTKIIMKNKGTVDKFIGDSIMAYWNAPFSVTNHQDLALTSALEQLKALEEINKNYEENSPLKIKIRIGINSGKAYVGEMGADDRNDYTALGSEVNKASILEQACKIYKTSCIISQSVKIALKKDYTIRLLDTISIEDTIKGAFNIYEVFKEGKPTQEEQIQIDSFEKALGFYYKKEFQKALDIFQKLENKNSNLNTYAISFHIKRCKKCLMNTSFFSPVTIINKKLISK
ncbi:CHASE2 domain-containing protein [Malaciobacter marinus]|uniref:CHASE2 domain-containing protein n=1 Tax=Malaciobacter marinus TaxID=505249 RepID=UPI003B0084C1